MKIKKKTLRGCLVEDIFFGNYRMKIFGMHLKKALMWNDVFQKRFLLISMKILSSGSENPFFNLIFLLLFLLNYVI